MKTSLKIGAIALVIGVVAVGTGLYHFAGKLVYPDWQAPGFSLCTEKRLKYWGPQCGDLSKTRALKFEDVSIPFNGLALAGWHVPCARNGTCRPSPGRFHDRAALVVHGGGTDRRQGVVLAEYFLKHGRDVYLAAATGTWWCLVRRPVPLPF